MGDYLFSFLVMCIMPLKFICHFVVNTNLKETYIIKMIVKFSVNGQISLLWLLLINCVLYLLYVTVCAVWYKSYSKLK